MLFETAQKLRIKKTHKEVCSQRKKLLLLPTLPSNSNKNENKEKWEGNTEKQRMRSVRNEIKQELKGVTLITVASSTAEK